MYTNIMGNISKFKLTKKQTKQIITYLMIVVIAMTALTLVGLLSQRKEASFLFGSSDDDDKKDDKKGDTTPAPPPNGLTTVPAPPPSAGSWITHPSANARGGSDWTSGPNGGWVLQSDYTLQEVLTLAENAAADVGFIVEDGDRYYFRLADGANELQRAGDASLTTYVSSKVTVRNTFE